MQLHGFCVCAQKFCAENAHSHINITPRETATTTAATTMVTKKNKSKSKQWFLKYFVFHSFIHRIADFTTMSIIIGLTLD